MRGFLRRHRAAVATNTALAVAAGAIVVYAFSADGYRAHRTELNDGGIWVTKSDKGYFGRINKPIGKLDGAAFHEDDADLDVLQDGAAVAGINGRSGRLLALDPATLNATDGSSASLAEGGQADMRGGTLATLDPGNGATWAVRYDPQLGDPLVSGVDQQGEALAKVGKRASLTVTQGGTVVVVSAAEDRVARWEPDGLQVSDATTEDLPDGADEPTAVTAVGEVAVTLDRESGAVQALDGPSASLPPGGVLQQPGPGAGSVLVAHDGGLSEVDLETGKVATLLEGVSGTPAAPVRLGACVYGAWSGGTGQVAVGCGDSPMTLTQLKGDATDLVFRVNRGEILLNDQDSGSVWEIDADKPQRIDNWEAFTDTKKVKQQEKDDEQETTGDKRPPQAKPDDFGARPGRTSVLYPLDNDAAPEGRLLAIQGVDQPNIPGARVTVSPDRQTLQLNLPENARGQVSFDYYIDDGRNMKDQATVSVDVRGREDNTAPALREGHEPRTWRVPAGGSIEVPVLPDWRDLRDSDPLMLESARVTSGLEGTVVRATTNGRLRLTAPGAGGDVEVEYAVSDGLSEPVPKTLRVTVQEKFEQVTYPATAEPDVVSGEVGKPIIVRPLANDLPGSDPSTPDAEIELEGRIPDQAGLRVRTDTNAGVVRVDSSRAGTYLLDYQASYGNAKLARGKIRVDVRPPPKDPEDPVATPDTLTLYGQAAATVDVLANDVDPAGGILVVQEARADRDEQVDVSIVDGRWLRISARQGDLSPRSQVVRYTISNGAASGTGEVLVTQRPRPVDNTPVTGPDRAVVRAGSVVAHPVLDDDFSPSGDRLELAADMGDGSPGQLAVEVPQDYTGDPGSAYVTGRTIRYVAPADLAEREAFTIGYAAVNSTGESSPGTLTVVVVPDEGPNTAPQAPTLEGRLVAGDMLRLRLPATDMDPDGDPVVITGISSPPRLGRILDFGANSMQFQAFPDSAGTEEFGYTVTDSQGAEATGVVRVAVVPPGPPQPPVAVSDSITVAPGATAQLDVLANDQIGAADRVTVELLDPPPGVSLDSDIGPVRIKAPDRAGADAVDVVYSLSNGIDSSLATARLEVVEGFNNPPVVQDAFGRADDSDSVTVDLLAADSDRPAAYDPDGEVADLRVVDVFADADLFELSGNTVTVRRGEAPRVVAFRVEDAGGAVASASLYVPATGTGRPYLKPDAEIELDSGASKSFDVGDYVVDPSGGEVVLTGRKQVWASPQPSMAARGTSATKVEVSARDDFRGPAAVLVEVVPSTDGSEERAAQPTIISIPVQVGTDRPEISCPDTPIQVAASDSIDIDIPSVCFVWTLDPAEKYTLDYSAEWASQVDGLSVAADGGEVVTVVAAGGARAGSRAELTVRAGTSEPDTLRIEVVRAPSPSLLSFSVPDMKPGDSRSIDLARYLRPGVSDADPTILDVQRVSGSSVNASSSGSVLKLNAPQGADGRTELRIEMSDVSGDPGPERRVSGRVSIEVLDKPTVPGAPAPIAIKDKAVTLSWQPSEPRGAPIDHYEVQTVDGSRKQRFRTNGGLFKVPANGRTYAFKVRAHNKVGYSDWSERSRSAVVDTAPGRVPWIRAENIGDGTLTLRWGKPRTEASDIQMYYIAWRNGTAEVPGTGRTHQITGLDNNQLYDFSIRARNATGTSEARLSGMFQTIGTPATPGGLRMEDLQAGVENTTVKLDWSGTLPEGPAPTTYTIQATSGNTSFTVPGCAKIEVTTCRHTGVPYDGRTWSYTVSAHNQPGNTSAPSAPVSFQAVGIPDPWGAWRWSATGNDYEVTLDYTVPVSRGARSDVVVLVNGAEVARNQETGARSRTIRLPNNLTPHDVQLRVCNEHVAQGGCSTSASQGAQSYGPLRGNLGSVTANVNGDTISWAIEGSSNGNPAKLDLAIYDGDTVQDFVTVDLAGRGPGAFTYVSNPIKLGWRSTQRIEVRLYDDAPGNRGQAYTENRQSTGEPPQPVAGVTKVACSDEEGSTNPCQNPGSPQGPCTDDACGRVSVQVFGFLSTYSCVVTQYSLGNPGGTVIHTIDGRNGDYDALTPAYADGGLVGVKCTTADQGDKARQSAEGSTRW